MFKIYEWLEKCKEIKKKEVKQRETGIDRERDTHREIKREREKKDRKEIALKIKFNQKSYLMI